MSLSTAQQRSIYLPLVPNHNFKMIQFWSRCGKLKLNFLSLSIPPNHVNVLLTWPTFLEHQVAAFVQLQMYSGCSVPCLCCHSWHRKCKVRFKGLCCKSNLNLSYSSGINPVLVSGPDLLQFLHQFFRCKCDASYPKPINSNKAAGWSYSLLSFVWEFAGCITPQCVAFKGGSCK